MLRNRLIAIGIITAIVCCFFGLAVMTHVTDPMAGESADSARPAVPITASPTDPVTDRSALWNSYRSNTCAISYSIPPGWDTNGLAENPIILISSPDDLLPQQSMAKNGDAEPSLASVSFYINCSGDVSWALGTDDASLMSEEALADALEKGRFSNSGYTRYVRTVDVASRKGFLFEVGNVDSTPGDHYESVFVFAHGRWVEIRPSMTFFSEMTQDQRDILNSIHFIGVE